MPKMIEKTEKILHKIVDIQQFIANMFLVFIMLIITFDVIGRNVLNKPLKGTFEMTELSAALLVFFALAITHRHGDHITIDFVVDRFSKKVRNMLNGVIEIGIVIVLFFIVRHIFDNCMRLMDIENMITDLISLIHHF